MTEELLKELDKTKDSLRKEAQDLQHRADALDWKRIEKNMIAMGFTEEDIKIEKELFDCVLNTTKLLAGKEMK
jgi:hypothetical protein